MYRHRQIGSLAALALLSCLTIEPAWAAPGSGKDLKAEAKSTEATDPETALARVSGGRIQSAELEREHGKVIWSFDIAKPYSKSIEEVQVDAKTRTVAGETTETPKDQATEAASERKVH